MLLEGLRREGAAWAEAKLLAFGERLAGEAPIWAEQANRYPPVLRAYDRYGHRIDEVEYHPAWHALLQLAVENAVHSLPWREPRPGAHVARSAFTYALIQVEAGCACPIAMTYSAVPALRKQPELAAEWEPRLTATEYDPRMLPAREKRGALCGMAMTEKQGGSDVQANTTRAVPLAAAGPGAEYALTGHKWFCSAPMSDAFLVLAQAERGLSCFLLPRFLPDGTRNRFHIQRLKDKLGDRSNASSEVEFNGAWARMVGEEGRGVPTIIDMVNHTRLDCVAGSAGLMRAALVQAVHHARHRSAFGKRLVEQPLMTNVLADLCLESEAATLVLLRLARAYDEAPHAAEARAFARLATAVAKYWVCKRAPSVTVEALECCGGNGFVEESVLPRIYRQAPLNSIWEGSGNVICLDVLRALQRRPEACDVFFAELDAARSGERRLDAWVSQLRDELAHLEDFEPRARRVVERMAVALCAALLVRFAPPELADAYCATRLAGEGGMNFGTLPPWVESTAIVERAL